MSRYRSFIPIMKSISQDGFEISASSQTTQLYGAFDGIKDGSGYYRSSIRPSLPEHLTITFPESKLIGRYTIYLGYYHYRYTNMHTWDFEGLINGEWVLLHSGDNPKEESATLTFDFEPVEVEGVRIKCKTRHGTNSWGIDELEVFEYVIHHKILLLSEDEKVKKVNYIKNETPMMTSSTEPFGEVKSSSYYISHYPWRAFNGNYGSSFTDGWLSNRTSNQWISFSFPEKTFIDSYMIFAFNDNRLPRHFKLEGSNDEVNWELLDERVLTMKDWVLDEWNNFDIDTPKEFKVYRLYCFDNNGGNNYIIIPEMRLSGIKKEVIQLPTYSEQDFINHGMSPQELSEIDFSSEFTEKRYIQNQSRPLGSGKVFEQPLDIDKIIKSVKIT